MLVIELATQNVKGFSPTARAALRPGYNVMVPPPGSQPGLLPIFSALLYGDGSGSDAMLATGPQARAGLTAQGSDGRVYRLVRALGGGGALHRLEPDNQWTVLAQESVDIGRHLRAALGIPSREAFDLLFTFSPQCLPSRRRSGEEKDVKDRGLALSGAEPGKLGLAADTRHSIRPTNLVEQAMAAAARGPSERQKSTSALKAEVEQGKALEELQYKLEGLQQRLFALNEVVTKVDKLVKRADQLKRDLSASRSLEDVGLTPDSLQTAARYDEARKKLQDQLGKLAQEDAVAQEMGPHVEPLWKDQQFLAGAGAGALSLGAGLALRSSGVGAISLLSIVGFGYAALCALRWIGKLQQGDAVQRRQNVTKDREQKLYAAFDSEFLLIKGAMKVAEIESGADFLAYFTRRQQQVDGLAEAERELAQAQGADLAAKLDEHDKLAKESKELEAQISQAGAGVTRDWHEAERELQESEQEQGGPPAPAPTAAAPGMVAVGGSFEAAAPAAPLKDDPTPKLLAAAQELFAGASLESLGAALRDRTSQYMVALTDRRYTSVQIDGKGGAELSAPGRNVPAGQLADLDLDLLYIAVKLTIVERYAPLGKPVLLLDEPFLGFDDAKLQLLSRMLKHIGAQTQVLHATALPAHQSLADVAHGA